MIVKHTYESGLSDINNEKRVKNKALLTILENIAGLHADSVKNGLYDIIDTGFTWVLLEWKMIVRDRPKYGEKLEVHTWARNSTKFYCYRDFEIYANGVKKVIASSKWMVVDIKALRPMRITDELIAKYNAEPDKNVLGIEEFEKMKERPSYDGEIDFAVRKADIDINGHVHNINYLDMAYEILNEEKEPDQVFIFYKKEIKYGDGVKVAMTAEDGSRFIKIYGESGVNALIEFKF